MKEYTIYYVIIGVVTALIGFPIFDFTKKQFYFRNLLMVATLCLLVRYILNLK